MNTASLPEIFFVLLSLSSLLILLVFFENDIEQLLGKLHRVSLKAAELF